MGYVVDEDDFGSSEFECYQVNSRGNIYPSPPYKMEFPNGGKWQYGYRSGPLSERDLNYLKEYEKTSTWGQTARSIGYLEQIMRSQSQSKTTADGRYFDVNRREYQEIDYSPSTLIWSGENRPSSGWLPRVDHFGAMGFTDVFRPLEIPLESTVRGEAMNRIRSVRPTRPDFNLTRFVGELRDANRLFTVPKAGSQGIGGAYLNGQFGWKATTEDIKRGADAIIRADELYKKFVKDGFAEYQARVSFDYESSESESTIKNRAVTFNPVTISNTDYGFKYHYAKTSNSADVPIIDVRVSSLTTIRAFARYNWYIGDPFDYSDRRTSYVDKARKLLGGGLTLGTAYDLTPFSWMVDWFYDIGGMLAYQQDVADYSLVADRAGAVMNKRSYLSATASASPDSTSSRSMHASGQASAIVRQSYRYPGNPYDMNANWDSIFTDPFKASITAALGLTKAKNIPFLKG